MKLRSVAATRAYHVTDRDFTHFDPRYISDIGFHFALDLEQCIAHLQIMEMESPILMTVDLNIKNPLQTTDALYWDEPTYIKNITTSDPQIDQANEMHGGFTPQQFRELLVQGGYDSIQYDNEYEASGTAIIVWDPQLITLIDRRRL